MCKASVGSMHSGTDYEPANNLHVLESVLYVTAGRKHKVFTLSAISGSNTVLAIKQQGLILATLISVRYYNLFKLPLTNHSATYSG